MAVKCFIVLLLYVAFQLKVLEALLFAVEAVYRCLTFEELLFLLVRCLLDDNLQSFKSLIAFVGAESEVVPVNTVDVKRSMND